MTLAPVEVGKNLKNVAGHEMKSQGKENYGRSYAAPQKKFLLKKVGKDPDLFRFSMFIYFLLFSVFCKFKNESFSFFAGQEI